jgi:hypothetical protein
MTDFGITRYGSFFLWVVAAALFCGCENVLWNDLAAQGMWEKVCEINFNNKTMTMNIDNSNIRWKEKSAEDWEVDLPCSASFGVLYIKFPDKTVKGTYVLFLNYLTLSGFEWGDRLQWLNGAWKK